MKGEVLIICILTQTSHNDKARKTLKDQHLVLLNKHKFMQLYANLLKRTDSIIYLVKIMATCAVIAS